MTDTHSKISSIKPKNPIGKTITPIGYGDGALGVGLQQQLYDDAGIKTNWGSGPDMPEFSTEIKSRKKNTKAHVTIGTSTRDIIIQTKGKIFLDKLQKITFYTLDLTPVDSCDPKVVDSYNIDFSSIQDIINDELESLAEQLNVDGFAIPKSKHFVLEQKTKNSYALRISSHRFTGLKNEITFKKLFEFEE